MMSKTKRVYLSLGSNIGNKMFYLISAIIKISELINTDVSKISKFYTTEPYGDIKQDDFINCAIEIKTNLLPYELLKELNRIEYQLNRKREIKWGPRTIDIDIIFYDDISLNRKDLIIPHKEYKKRNFVLYPLGDIIDSEELDVLKSSATGAISEYRYNKKLLISNCLLGVNCKYNGGNNFRKVFKKINIPYVPICPETFGGLKIPRVPSEIQSNRTVLDKTGLNVSNAFELGAAKSLEIAIENNCEIALMKSKSPSCGYGRIYDGSFSDKLIEENGITAEKLEENNILVIEVN